MSARAYSYGKRTPAHGWAIYRDTTPVLALPPDLPELVIGAIAATIQAEADHAREAQRRAS